MAARRRARPGDGDLRPGPRRRNVRRCVQGYARVRVWLMVYEGLAGVGGLVFLGFGSTGSGLEGLVAFKRIFRLVHRY